MDDYRSFSYDNSLSFYNNGRRCTCRTCKNYPCPTNESPCKECLPGLGRGFFLSRASKYDEDPRFTSATIKVHELKILPKYFVRAKNFELRKNDRDFQVGEIVVLREWDAESGYTGRYSAHVIKYILENAKEYGFADGYCILALSDSAPH